MKTKALAMAAVLMMVLAGAGVFVGEAADADDPVTYDLNIMYDGLITDEDTLAVIAAMGGTISYQAQLADDLEERITILNLKYYEALEDGGYIVGNYVIFTADDLNITNIKNGIKEFTYAEFNKTGKLVGGVDTIVKFANVLPASFGGDYDMALVTAADKDEAVAIAVIETTALIEELYKDYKSPAQVQEAIDAATAAVEAKYADYLSPEEAQSAIETAVALAVMEKDIQIALLNEYIEELEDTTGAVVKQLKEKVAALEAQAEADAKTIAEKQKVIEDLNKTIEDKDKAIAKDKDLKTIYLAVAIILGVIAVALGGYTGYGLVKKAKAKKAIEEKA